MGSDLGQDQENSLSWFLEHPPKKAYDFSESVWSRGSASHILKTNIDFFRCGFSSWKQAACHDLLHPWCLVLCHKNVCVCLLSEALDPCLATTPK